jgi:hypothetical protein
MNGKQKAQALYRAEFYRWSAARGRTLPGNDIFNGLPRDDWRNRDHHAESSAAYKAMARAALNKAKALPPSPLPG